LNIKNKFLSQNIVLIAGGSGGHVHPAISVYEQFKDAGANVSFFTDSRAEEFLNEIDTKTVYRINSSTPFRRSLISKLFFPFLVILGVIQSLVILSKISPKIVIAFGGYTAFPSCIAARLLGLPIIIHEQNIVMGRANRVIANLASVIALSFEETHKVSHKYKKKIIHTGLPMRKSILRYRTKNFNYAHNNKEFNILVIGGSQSAGIFTSIIPKSLSQLPIDIRENITVTQNAHKHDIETLTNEYSNLNIKSNISMFFKNIGYHIKSSDLVITRAGANSLFEVSYIGRPSILVPLPKSLDADQYYNATYFKDKGSCFVIDEGELTSDILSRKLFELYINRDDLHKLAYTAYDFSSKFHEKNFIEILQEVLE
tara:strand:- start:1549 stop:2661 length:1113 start_codon:yes stop_codon:yes gene_type:complete